jgi:hypothetical protein
MRGPCTRDLVAVLLLCLLSFVSAGSKAPSDAEEETIFLIFTPKCFAVFNEGLEQLFLKFDIVGIFHKFDYYLP